MSKENVVCLHSEVLFSHTEEWKNIICMKMCWTGDYLIKWNNTNSERHIFRIFPYMDSRFKKIPHREYGGICINIIELHCRHVWQCHDKIHCFIHILLESLETSLA